jgi:hypothetical protein
MRVAAGVLGVKARGFGIVEDGAEAAARVAGDGELRRIDDDAGDALGGILALDAGFLFVDAEAFIGGDMADAREEVADFLIGVGGIFGRRGGGWGGEGEIVGIAGVSEAELSGDAGEAGIEAAGDEVGEGGAGGGRPGAGSAGRWRREGSGRRSR